MLQKFIWALWIPCFVASSSVHRTEGIVINESRIFSKFLFEFDEPIFDKEIEICLANIKFVLGESVNSDANADSEENVKKAVSEGKAFTVIYKGEIKCICYGMKAKANTNGIFPITKKKLCPSDRLEELYCGRNLAFPTNLFKVTKNHRSF